MRASQLVLRVTDVEHTESFSVRTPICVFAVAAQQTPNLAATLQAAAHVTVTSAQGVRLNPVMVTVDPRHPSLSVQAQYASTTEGKLITQA